MVVDFCPIGVFEIEHSLLLVVILFFLYHFNCCKKNYCSFKQLMERPTLGTSRLIRGAGSAVLTLDATALSTQNDMSLSSLYERFFVTLAILRFQTL
jgi:hypothetical protein